jgi:hypothetical protein
MMAQISNQESTLNSDNNELPHDSLRGLANNQIRIARLRLLLIAAKVVYHSTDKVKYSIHDMRTPGLMHFLNFLDKARNKVRPWVEGSLWPCRFSLNNI